MSIDIDYKKDKHILNIYYPFISDKLLICYGISMKSRKEFISNWSDYYIQSLLFGFLLFGFTLLIMVYLYINI